MLRKRVPRGPSRQPTHEAPRPQQFVFSGVAVLDDKPNWVRALDAFAAEVQGVVIESPPYTTANDTGLARWQLYIPNLGRSAISPADATAFFGHLERNYTLAFDEGPLDPVTIGTVIHEETQAWGLVPAVAQQDHPI